MSRLSWHQRAERARLAIIRDLITYDLLRCKTISLQRHTAHLTAILHEMPTEGDVATYDTVTMETEVSNRR